MCQREGITINRMLKHHRTAGPEQRRCWAEIDLGQLIRNLRLYRSALPEGSEIMTVIKANAYGHGDRVVAEALYGEGIRRFAVAALSEGVRLRPLLPEAEILILGWTPVEDAALLSRYRLTQALVSRAYAEALAAAARGPIDCCYAIDTGMRRIGLDAEALDETEAAIRAVRIRSSSEGSFPSVRRMTWEPGILRV